MDEKKITKATLWVSNLIVELVGILSLILFINNDTEKIIWPVIVVGIVMIASFVATAVAIRYPSLRKVIHSYFFTLPIIVMIVFIQPSFFRNVNFTFLIVILTVIILAGIRSHVIKKR